MSHPESVSLGNDKDAYSIAEFCHRYSIGRTTCYAEIKAGRLHVVKAGRRTLIPLDEVRAWLCRLARTGGR